MWGGAVGGKISRQRLVCLLLLAERDLLQHHAEVEVDLGQSEVVYPVDVALLLLVDPRPDEQRQEAYAPVISLKPQKVV
jgi:hypothetical protein